MKTLALVLILTAVSLASGSDSARNQYNYRRMNAVKRMRRVDQNQASAESRYQYKLPPFDKQEQRNSRQEWDSGEGFDAFTRRRSPQQQQRHHQQQQPQYSRDGAQYDEYGNRMRHQQRQRNQYQEQQRPNNYYEELQVQRQDFEPQIVEQQQQQPQRPRRKVQIPRGQNRNPDFDYQQRRPQYPQQQQQQQQLPQRASQPRVDPVLEAEIDDVLLAEPQELPVYKPASGPAFADSTNLDEYFNNGASRQVAEPRFDPLPPVGHEVPAEQRSIQDAVFHEANAYKPDGVYQTEDRLEFQIHGHQGPHSYRYGYDTGHGYNRQFRYEERDKDGYVKGRYGFFDKYGKLKIVNYTADPYKGFHAEGAHVPQYPH